MPIVYHIPVSEDPPVVSVGGECAVGQVFDLAVREVRPDRLPELLHIFKGRVTSVRMQALHGSDL